MFTTADFLRFIAVILALPGAFFFFRAIARAKSSRTAAYYATRRQAANASNRDLSSFAIIAILATGMFIVSIFWPPELPNSEPAEPLVANIVTPAPTLKAATLVPATATVRATATPLAATPSTYATTVRITPTEKSASTELPVRRLVLRAISNAITAGGQPISPTTEFTKGVTRIYVIYDYVDFQQSVLIHQVWLRDGVSLYYDSSTWSHTGSGSGYLTWSPKNGFEPGLYEVRITLGDTVQFSANFVVH